jgi:hypothetical protein
MVFETVREVHDVVVGEGTGNEDGHRGLFSIDLDCLKINLN